MKETTEQTPHEPRPVDLRRTFQAPIDRVWDAFTKREHIHAWWVVKDVMTPHSEIDFKEGGKFKCGMHSGTIKTIETNRRIVFLADSPEDQQGKIVVDFEELGRQRTGVRILHHGVPAGMVDEYVGGWLACLNKLQKLVEQH